MAKKEEIVKDEIKMNYNAMLTDKHGRKIIIKTFEPERVELWV